jgi:hypothetical protein
MKCTPQKTITSRSTFVAFCASSSESPTKSAPGRFGTLIVVGEDDGVARLLQRLDLGDRPGHRFAARGRVRRVAKRGEQRFERIGCRGGCGVVSIAELLSEFV